MGCREMCMKSNKKIITGRGSSYLTYINIFKKKSNLAGTNRNLEE